MQVSDLEDILKKVKPYGYDNNIMALGWVFNININSDEIRILISVPVDFKNTAAIETQCKALIKNKFNIDNVGLIFTAEKASFKDSANQDCLAGTTIITVSSGKGGVGKSTIAATTAVVLKNQGYRVGLFDADVYGPSIPHLFGLQNIRPKTDGKKIIPVEFNDLQIMSIGFVIDSSKGLVWRGPLIAKWIAQMFLSVVWNKLDILIIDMPPGTGDIAITIIKTLKFFNILVSSASQVDLIDVERSLDMFVKTKVNTIGIVENMSYMECNSCNAKNYLFGTEDNIINFAKKNNLDYLGSIPFFKGDKILSEVKNSNWRYHDEIIAKIKQVHEL